MTDEGKSKDQLIKELLDLRQRVAQLEVSQNKLERVKKTLRASEELFRTVSDFTYDWEYWIGPEGNYPYVSPSCERITGYRPDEFQKDPGLLKTITHPDDRTEIASHIDEESEREEVRSCDFRIISRNGAERWISHLCQPVYSPDGRYLGRRASNRDITQRKRAEEALKEARDNLERRVRERTAELERVNKQLKQEIEERKRTQQAMRDADKLVTVGKLAAGVAHSIRNPLTSVKMRLFYMEKTVGLSESEREDLKVISEEIRHIDGILRNFLEYSRPPRLRMQKVSPSDVVDMALDLLGQRLDSYGVEVRLGRQSWLPEIYADPDQLKEVLVNLLVNSCEAMGYGGLIVIHEEEVEDELLDRKVVIRVSDNGPGIPESIRDKLFEPFFTTKEEGTGLGLTISARIIEEHGGKLELSSREGDGAILTITLPFREGKS